MCVASKVYDAMTNENDTVERGERFHENFFISFFIWFRHYYNDHRYGLFVNGFLCVVSGGIWLIFWPFFDLFMYWINTADSKELSESRRNE